MQLLTPDLPGTGGLHKATPEDFIVDELPAYAPSGEGGHTFLRIEKRGLTTAEAIARLCRALGVSPNEVGAAGQKDRQALTRQWISLPNVDPERALAASAEGVRVLEAARHGHKLRTGHLAGNRFSLTVRGVVPDGARRARAPSSIALVERRDGQLLRPAALRRARRQRGARQAAVVAGEPPAPQPERAAHAGERLPVRPLQPLPRRAHRRRAGRPAARRRRPQEDRHRRPVHRRRHGGRARRRRGAPRRPRRRRHRADVRSQDDGAAARHRVARARGRAVGRRSASTPAPSRCSASSRRARAGRCWSPSAPPPSAPATRPTPSSSS